MCNFDRFYILSRRKKVLKSIGIYIHKRDKLKK